MHNNNENIALYLPLNGLDGAVTTTDYSMNDHAITFNGNAQISKDTAYNNDVQSSLKLDGSGDYLTIPYAGSFEHGAADTTIMFSVYFNTVLASQGGFYTQRIDADNWYQIYHRNNMVYLLYRTSSGDRAYYTWNFTPEAQTWYSF